jgi:8-oxo-dGTP diphosphatase
VVPKVRSELEKYPRPSVAVDVALLTVVPGTRADQLSVLVHRRSEGVGAGQWALPGRFLRPNETLEQAALVALREKVGVQGQRPRQLRVFDEQGRDDRGWVLSVAHVDLVPFDWLPPELRSDCRVAPLVGEAVQAQLPGNERLFFDHDDIVRTAVAAIRDDYRWKPDPSRLLGDAFTLYDLRRLHEAVLGETVPQKDTFRRRMAPQLDALDELEPGRVGRPAKLYRRRPEGS